MSQVALTPADFQSNPNWYGQLFESSPDPSWIIDDNHFVECNEAAVRALGYASRETLLNVHPSKLSPTRQSDGQDSYVKAERMMGLVKEKGAHRFEWTHTRADGTDFLAEVRLSVVQLGARQVIYCVWGDITERKSVEEKLLRQNNTLSAIIENFPGGISLFDADLRLAACNEKFKRLLDLPQALFENPRVAFEDFIRYNVLRGDYGPGDAEQQVQAIVERARNFQPHKMERVRPNGIALEIRGMPLPDGGFVTTYMDITARKLAEEEIRTLAFYDALTRLPNRRLLRDRLGLAMASSKRSARYAALMFLDLDNFKPLNDTQGHGVGDMLLIEAANRLSACVREMDTVSRFGGDEFVVLLSELHEDRLQSGTQAEAVARKIQAALSQPYRMRVKQDGMPERVVEHRCTASLGVALFLGALVSQDDVLKWADAAMYRAKEDGRNLIRFHESIE